MYNNNDVFVLTVTYYPIIPSQQKYLLLLGFGINVVVEHPIVGVRLEQEISIYKDKNNDGYNDYGNVDSVFVTK